MCYTHMGPPIGIDRFGIFKRKMRTMWQGSLFFLKAPSNYKSVLVQPRMKETQVDNNNKSRNLKEKKWRYLQRHSVALASNLWASRRSKQVILLTWTIEGSVPTMVLVGVSVLTHGTSSGTRTIPSWVSEEFVQTIFCGVWCWWSRMTLSQKVLVLVIRLKSRFVNGAGASWRLLLTCTVKW